MRAALALVLLLAPQAATAACRDMDFDGASFTICEVTAAEDLRLFHSGEGGLLGSFAAVNNLLAVEGRQLGFAMNAGMYHEDRKPVGLYIENGREITRIVTRDGPGNFGLLPNAVFCIGEELRVIESRAFAKAPPACRHATQSGPMLVIDGALHPKLLPESDSTNIRNGVGTTADGNRAVFAISNEPVNFHHFARLFRDGLGLRDALYLDGSISRLHAPELDRSDLGFPMGPIVGTAVPKG